MDAAWDGPAPPRFQGSEDLPCLIFLFVISQLPKFTCAVRTAWPHARSPRRWPAWPKPAAAFGTRRGSRMPWRLRRLQSFAAQACFGRRKKVGSERENKIGFIACKPQLCSACVCFARGQVLPPARHAGDGEGQQGAAGRHATAATSAPGPIGPTSAPGPIGPTSAPGLCRHAVRRRRFLAPQAAALVRHTGARAMLCRAVLCQRILGAVSVAHRRVRVCFRRSRSTWLSCDMLRCLATCCAVLRRFVATCRPSAVQKLLAYLSQYIRALVNKVPTDPSQPIRPDPSRSESAPHPVPAQIWARPGADAGESRRRCGRVPAQMWASPGADVGESRRRCHGRRFIIRDCS